jgi:hypothetical protein
MLRVVGRRFGGRVGASSGSGLLCSGGDTAAASALTASKAVKGASAADSSPLLTSTEATGLVDVVLPRVDCTLLKHVLSSSSSSSTSTEIPDMARVLRLDYTAETAAAKAGAAYPLADILLVNRIHAAVIEDTQLRAREGDAPLDPASSPPQAPLLVLVETRLSQEDAEVQQFIIRNALRMHPLPPVVEVPQTGEMAAAPPLQATTPPLNVLVLGAEVTERVRTLAHLPSPPSLGKRVPPAVLVTTAAARRKSKQQTAVGSAEVAKDVVVAPVKASQPVESGLPPPPPRPIDNFAPTPTHPTKSGGGRHTSVARGESRRKAQQQRKRTAAALLRQHAATRLKAARGRKSRAAHLTRKAHTPPRRSTSKAGRKAAGGAPAKTPTLPPRLLSVDDTTEKLLWTSQPGHPLPLAALTLLINTTVFARMCAAAKSRSATATAPLSLHTIVYRAGAQSSAQTVWLGAVQAAADLAVALSHGHSQLPGVVAELAALSHASFTVDAPRQGSAAAATSKQRRHGKARKSGPRTSSASSPSLDTTHATAAAAEPPYIYLLIHTSLSPQDAAVLQQELDYQHVRLKDTPAGAEVAGVAVLTTQDVSSTHLLCVLEYGVAEGGTTTAGSDNRAAVGSQVCSTLARGPLSPEGAEMARTFHDVYRILTEQPELLLPSSPATDGPQKRSAEAVGTMTTTTAAASAAVPRHPDTVVADALRIAALTQALVQRREAQLRDEFTAAQQRSAVGADSEAVARAAQKVEMKTMVTEAVEEVSVRHEQATAHLVKTLSSMVGQWSLEKLSDTLEVIMRDEVKPIIDVLEERLGTAAQGGAGGGHTAATQHPTPPTSPSHDGREGEAVSADALATSTPTTARQESLQHEERTSGNEEALLNGQREMQQALEEVLAQLRELSDRAAALSAAAETAAASAAAQTRNAIAVDVAPAEEEREEHRWAVSVPPAVDEERLLQEMREIQQQHHSETQQTLEILKKQLEAMHSNHSVVSRDATLAHQAAASATVPAVSPEVVESAVSRAVEEVSVAISQGIKKNVVEQLDSYCEVLRNSNSNGSGNNEPTLPLLPVTSFELEEMLTRTVNFAVREASHKVEGHVRVAIEKALHDHASAAASPTMSSSHTPRIEGEDNNGSSSAMKAALEELWSQVKAEAAEVEAVKLSQHNRQLQRLFRRQQHLRKISCGDGNATGSGLTLMAVEEAVRAAMHPYMAQVQAAVTAATAAAQPRAASNASSPSSSSPNKEE